MHHYVADNSTVNICALDISEAFDRVDHFALLQGLMDRNVPRTFIDVLLNWLMKSFVCVRWCRTLSFWYQLTAGVHAARWYIVPSAICCVHGHTACKA